MKSLGWVGVLIVVAGCATQPAPPPLPPPPPPPPPMMVSPPPVVSQRAAPPLAAPLAADVAAPSSGPGAHLVLQIDMQAVLHDRLGDIEQDARDFLNARHADYDLSHSGDVLVLRVGSLSVVPQMRPQLSQLCMADGTPRCQVSLSGPQEFTIALTQFFRRRVADEVLRQSVQAVRRRLAMLSFAEPRVSVRPGNRIVADVPGYFDLDALHGLFAPPRGLTWHRVDDDLSAADISAGNAPPDVVFLNYMDGVADSHHRPLPIYRPALLSGDCIADTRQSIDPYSNAPIVTLVFDADGAKQLADITRGNVGRRLALVLDDKVLDAAKVMEPIVSGTLTLSGDFTDGAAMKLATLLRAGSGPAPWTIVELKRN